MSGLSSLDEAKLVLLKTSGVGADNETPTAVHLHKYMGIYTRSMSPFFILEVSALVDVHVPRKRKEVRVLVCWLMVCVRSPCFSMLGLPVVVCARVGLLLFLWSSVNYMFIVV
jgi:hypothetical protein